MEESQKPQIALSVVKTAIFSTRDKFFVASPAAAGNLNERNKSRGPFRGVALTSLYTIVVTMIMSTINLHLGY